ncbi:MAG: hypothetical protein KDB14_23850 [Planctomycetales bacterium]|nr:hypothetical protein [Planctomycetales bacterium]
MLITASAFAQSTPTSPPTQRPAAAAAFDAQLASERLVAWCIVPFDATKRSPQQRAQMLKTLGLRRCAYDWRAEHVESFEEEILQYKQHGIEYFAFWSEHPQAFELFKKHDLHPQIWRMMPSPDAATQTERVELAAQAMAPLAKQTAEMKCKLGIYNHGGWAGEPENMVAVCLRLREMGYDHVGIVYNFHHGHEHIGDWKRHWAAMKPLVHCLNLNGMRATPEPKILGLGKGEHELEMMRVVRESGYDGPIGILDHRPELDAAESLQENLDGLKWLRAELKSPGSGGAKPVVSVKRPAGEFGHSQVVPSPPSIRELPLTAECVASLARKDNYNILVASETKTSPLHWEIFSMRGSGHFTAYFPGLTPDHVRSSVDICDGKPHRLAMVYESSRVRLLVDGKVVADANVKRVREAGESKPGGLGLGRLVEGGLSCSGHIDWIHLQRGAATEEVAALAQPAAGDRTLKLWRFDKPAAESAAAAKFAPYDADLVAELVAAAAEHGDAARGARVFAHAKFACLSCHRALGHGGAIGPDLSQVARQRTPTQLVESLFWPRREVKPEFVMWHAMTDDGEVLKGYRLPGDDILSLKDPATGVVRKVPRDQVTRLRDAATLMPDGLAQSMTRRQQLDVIRFLTTLGAEEATESLAPLAMTLMHAHSHRPAEFKYDRAPLRPADWPSWQHAVNRDRIYDFYTKQAEHFRTQPAVPMLLAAFPGLDGGQQGHWGNQNEQTWADNRWNDVRLGSVQCGVFRGAGKTVPRAVCVQLGDAGDVFACFNPETLEYEAVWKGEFLKFSGVRHGFLHGVEMAGRPTETATPLGRPQPELPFQYRGFYRHGQRVLFRFRIGETDYLDAPWAEEGRFVRHVAPLAEHPLRGLLKGGDAQWPQTLELPVRLATTAAEGPPYVIDTFVMPTENPWNVPLFCGGHDFLSNGDALICTMHGDVWRVTDEGETARWRRFASGLHQPLGLVVAEDRIYVLCRDQLTELIDRNGDGEADEYRRISSAFDTSPAGHDFICGLQIDRQNRFYTASGNQGLIRISAGAEKVEVLGTGFRNPDGLGLRPDGLVTVPCSEGSWTPASQICGFFADKANSDDGDKRPPFFGLGGPERGKVLAPLAYLPRGLDNSSGGQVYVDSNRWGPLSGQMVHLSFGAGSQFLLLVDQVDGQLQGAVSPLPGEFLSGAHRGRFHPRDGQLYVSGMAGWGSYTPEDGCFQRVRYTGARAQLPIRHRAHQNGVLVTFSEPVSSRIAEDPRSHFAQCWNYRFSGGYGSPEFSTRHPGVVGHDPLEISSCHVQPDGRSVFLEIPELQPCSQLHLRMHVGEGDACDLFLTVNRLAEPFAKFPGYQPVEKVVAAHPLESDLALADERKPNPWAKRIPGARVIRLETGKNLTFAQTTLNAAPGEALELVLVNPDVVPHNWALTAPGSLRTVGEMANHLVADPAAFARHYIPETDLVLAHTDVVSPGTEFHIYFRAPSKPGRYPYLCTFPGHWMVMNGELVVK